MAEPKHHPLGSIARGTLLCGGVALFTACGSKETDVTNVYPDQEPATAETAPVEEFAEADSAADQSAGPARTTEPGVRPTGPGLTGIPERTPPDGPAPAGRRTPDLQPILFALNSDVLTPEAEAQLATHAEWLLANPEIGVILRGHTDASGTDDYNMSLGSRRAQSVREVLVGLGVPADRVTTISYGEMVPARDNAPDAENRRVEFFVFETE